MLTNEINGLGRPTPSNRGIDFKRVFSPLSNPISAGYRRVLRSKKFIQAEEQKRRSVATPALPLSVLALWQAAIAPNSLPCLHGCVPAPPRAALPPVVYTGLRNPAQ